ncbi:MAG: BamA/TamA family outer membrane protein, partial [Myxococcota bacterium]|nr:BamA/TamA family outer membrane protein [Myxococcota bacterium]
FETGNLWYEVVDWDLNQFQVGTGVGLSYRTPVGPLTLSIAWNPTAAAGENSYDWHFKVGS